MPRALITGISGQDGYYLAKHLLGRGYDVHGATRGSTRELARLHSGKVKLHAYSMDDDGCWRGLVAASQPDEIYHLAADSFVPNGWEQPAKNVVANYLPVVELLETLRHDFPNTKLLNACSREVFGNQQSLSADENTPMHPTTMYGIHKAASRWAVAAYRERYGVYACSAILFNHESPRRPPAFVTRKITQAVAEIARGRRHSLELGNVNVQRDWSYAGDIVDAVHRMLQHQCAEDFVLGSGVPQTISEFAQRAFAAVDLDWTKFVKSDSSLRRSGETGTVTANATKAAKLLNWQSSTTVSQLVEMMVRHDLNQIDRPQRRAA